MDGFDGFAPLDRFQPHTPQLKRAQGQFEQRSQSDDHGACTVEAFQDEVEAPFFDGTFLGDCLMCRGG